VQDKQTVTSDHYGTTAFIIGSQYDDLLQGGVAGDYLYGGAGNDTIKTGAGADRVDGGAGKDNLRLEGSQSDWDVYRLSDGTLFFNAHNGTGLKQAEGVEQISFENEWLSWTRPYDVTASGLEDNRSLISWFDQDVAYRKATEGTTGNDVLSGKAVFGQDGNDVLTALSSGSLLHGGEGNDALKGGSGNDALYGAEGNDVLYASAGYDQLYGGVGDDVFRLGASANNTHIMDFNQANGDHDRLLFAHTVFGSTAALGAAAHQVANDVVIAQGNFHLTVHDALLQEVLYSSAIIVG
jgi:triacylglycerol lipase